MKEIQVKYCPVCGEIEDVHTTQNIDGTVTMELSCRCGKGETRRVTVEKGEGYWLALPVALHTHEAAKGREDG